MSVRDAARRLPSLVIAIGCGSKDAPAPATAPVAPVAPPRDAAIAVADAVAAPGSGAPIAVAVFDGDRLARYKVTRTGVARVGEVKLPEQLEDATWLDAEHLVAVGASGQVYRVAGETIMRYRMPKPSAWHVHGDRPATRATFPNRPRLVRDDHGALSLASCATYDVGDDDPCVTWAVAPLLPTLHVGRPQPTDSEPSRDDAPDVKVAAPSGFELETAFVPARVDVTCTARGTTKHRSWDYEGACGVIGADTGWIATVPPLAVVAITTSCGEGADVHYQHVVRACELTDVAGSGEGTAAVVWADGLWGYRGDDGWSVRAGEREVGTIEVGTLVTRP